MDKNFGTEEGRKLSEEEKLRYARQRALPGIGSEGQSRLLASSVAVIGCGALGSLCAMYLAGAGVGRIRICDFDTIDISNLQRQLFFATEEAGQKKSGILAARMRGLNPGIKVEEVESLFSKRTAREILEGIDFVIEATDNPSSKYLTDEICAELEIPCCIGGVREYSGQVITVLPDTLRYSDLYPERPEEGGFTPCGMGGVLGPAAGVVASIQAAEAIKYLSQTRKRETAAEAEEPGLLTDRLFTFDLADLQAGILEL